MATKIENLELELAHLYHFKDKIPGFEIACDRTVKIIAQLGGLQISTLFEQALAQVGSHQMVSQDQGDLYRNGLYSDAKLSTVRTSSYGTSYSAPVKKIFNKTGILRVQVYERKTNQFFYFAVPRRAYANMPKTSNIEIPFELDGTPRRVPSRPTRRIYENWWNFEVPSWDEMAKC